MVWLVVSEAFSASIMQMKNNTQFLIFLIIGLTHVSSAVEAKSKSSKVAAGKLLFLEETAGIGMQTTEIKTTKGHWLLKGVFNCKIGDSLYVEPVSRDSSLKAICCHKSNPCAVIDHTF